MLRKPILLLILLLGLPLIALAQPGDTTITIGDPVTGTLTAGNPSARYALQGQANATITILLTSEAFDSYLTLIGPDGAELATDDDSGGGKNAQITNFILPADGTYIIVAESYNRVSSGDYELSVTRTLGVLPTMTPVPTQTLAPLVSPEATAQPAGEISYGESVTGSLSEATPAADYTFSGSEGDVLTITATSDDFDTFLTLRDASGAELATDDDRAGNLNAQIQAFTLPADGTYTVTVSSYNNASSGVFALSVEAVGQAANAGTPTPIPTKAPVIETTAEATEITVTQAAGGELTIGDTVTGTLTANAPAADYTFEGRAGQVVTITLTSDDFDAFLLLRDAANRTLASNDDGAGGYNARIEAFSLPADATYTIVAGSYTNAETGSYMLALEFASANYPTAVPTETGFTATPTPLATFTPTPFILETAEATSEAGHTIAVGQSVTGTLTSDIPTTAYTLEGRAGELITITLASDQFDTYLRLLDPSGVEVATDDDGGGGLNAQIGLFKLLADGRYTILAESFSDETGDYTLSVSSIEPRLIEYTQTVQGTLTAGTPFAVYQFTGQAGDVVAVNADSSDFDAYLKLAQPDSGTTSLMEDDDSGGNLNALIGPYTLPTTGDYFVVVSSTDGSTGTFSLSLVKAQKTRIAYGDAVIGEFSADTPALYYSFEGAVGDVIHISVNSGGTLDTSLSLRGPDGYEAAFDDDSGANNDPEINRLVLNQDGDYMLLVKTFKAGQTGRIRLTVTREVLASLDEGTQQIELSEKQAQDVLTFTGAAGQRVRLNVRALDNVNNAPTITVTQDGQTLATSNATTVSALMLEFVVPSDGAVNVQVSDTSFSQVTLELSLERVEE